MTEWLRYERQRAAFEKKWEQRIFNALQAQLHDYTKSLRAGRPNLEIFTGFALSGVLLRLYANVGAHFAREQYRELRAEVRTISSRNRNRAAVDAKGLRRNRTGSESKVRSRTEDHIQLKRGSLGFSFSWAQKIISLLRMSALEYAQKLSNFTRAKVLSILEEAQRENLSLDETVKRIETEVGEINRMRAERITRTEVGRAAGEGKMQGAKALGVEMDKVWISARDHRTRVNPGKDPRGGDHWVLNGQRKAMEEAFDNGTHRLMQPGDKTAPPAETINCRCTVVFKVRKDTAGNAIRRDYI